MPYKNISVYLWPAQVIANTLTVSVLFLQGDLMGNLGRQNKWYFFRLNHILLRVMDNTLSSTSPSHPCLRMNTRFKCAAERIFHQWISISMGGCLSCRQTAGTLESVGLLLMQDHEEPRPALSQRPAASSNSAACIIAVNWSRWTGRLGVYSLLCPPTQDTWLAYSACSFLACKKTHF